MSHLTFSNPAFHQAVPAGAARGRIPDFNVWTIARLYTARWVTLSVRGGDEHDDSVTSIEIGKRVAPKHS